MSDPCTGEENKAAEKSYLMSLFDFSAVSEYFSGMYPVDMGNFMSNPDEGKTTWWYITVSLVMAGWLFFTMVIIYTVFFGLRACCNKFATKKENPAVDVEEFIDERTNGFT